MPTPLLTKVTVQGEDIQDFILDKLAPVCDGADKSVCILSMLAYVIILVKPHISAEKLQTVVMDTSEHMMGQLIFDELPNTAVN
jgi:hypothetical protein